MSVSTTQQLSRVGMATAIMLAAAASATAQSATESRSTTQPATRPAGAQAQAGQQGNLDQQIAACLHLGNQEEVILAQVAQQKAQNPEVKQFAQTMIEQHQQAIRKIEQAAPELSKANLKLASNQSSTQSDSQDRQSGSQAGSQDRVTPASNTAARDADNTQANYETSANGASSKQLQLAKSIKQQCLQLSQQELNSKQGVEFDKCYMGMQVAAHSAMLAELRGSREFATGQLQQVIDQGEQMTQQHLEKAKSIMKQIKDEKGAQRTSAQ